jgi:polysaccharide export outer membrane protein
MHPIPSFARLVATVRWAALVLVSVMLIACAGGQEVVSEPAPEKVEQNEYRIGPGDTLQVFVWNHPELTVTVPVRPDGMISTPLIAGVAAASKTASQLAKDLETALAEFVRNPTVSVMVTGFVGSYADQIRVVGQAAMPQSLPYRANMSLLDVMIAVGGLAEFAAGNRSVLVREEGQKRLRIPVRLRDLVDKGDITANVPMRPGDVLIIPESRF